MYFFTVADIVHLNFKLPIKIVTEFVVASYQFSYFWHGCEFDTMLHNFDYQVQYTKHP